MGSNAPSLSKSALVLGPCLAWAGPQARWFDEDKVDRTDTEARDNGIAFHGAMDAYLSTGIKSTFHDPELFLLQEYATKYLDEELLPRCEQLFSEVAVEVNWVTEEAAIQHGVTERGYIKKGGFQNGTADLVGILKDGSLYVADWKTGGSDGAREQLLSLACALQLCMPTENGLPRPVIISCLSVNEHGVWPKEESVSEAQLQEHWDSMRFQWERIQDGDTGSYKTGIHCTTLYCPHLAYCNAIGGSVDEASSGPQAVGGNAPLIPASSLTKGLRHTGEPVSDEEAGYTMARISAARRQMKYQEAQLKDYVSKQGGRVTMNGYVWEDRGNGWRWYRK